MDKKLKRLAGAVTMVFAQRNSSFEDANDAMLSVMVYGCIEMGVAKAQMIEQITAKWDEMEAELRDALEKKRTPRGEDYKVVMGADTESLMKADPKVREAINDIVARMRQNLDGVATGKFADPGEALDALGGVKISIDELPPEVRRALLDLSDTDIDDDDD
jgi:hypothetical protein